MFLLSVKIEKDILLWGELTPRSTTLVEYSESICLFLKGANFKGQKLLPMEKKIHTLGKWILFCWSALPLEREAATWMLFLWGVSIYLESKIVLLFVWKDKEVVNVGCLAQVSCFHGLMIKRKSSLYEMKNISNVIFVRTKSALFFYKHKHTKTSF